MEHKDYVQRQKIKSLSIGLWGEGNPVEIMGSHPAIFEVERKIKHFSKSDTPVLITGPSGVGKEVFARSLYLLSSRKGKPFITVNCGRFHDEHILVSELFGHKKGSFTGAVNDQKGIFEAAHGGTVFLDEVAEMSLTAQKMFLRVLETGEIKPLGSNVTKKTDVRIIAATHQDLSEMMQKKSFREDLYFRLDCINLKIPPLKDRGADWQLLINFFLNPLTIKHGIEKKFSSEAYRLLENYSWPGNVRELKNIVESGYWMSRDNVITVENIEDKLMQNKFQENDALTEYFSRMTEGGESFWDVIREPFLDRELNRKEVRFIIKRGLDLTKGSYKDLLKLFNIVNYRRFINFLNKHKLTNNLSN